MLSKRALAFIGIILTGAVVAACSNLGLTTGQNVGPTFPGKTLYATNSNQNAISIYSNGQKSGTGPAFEIGGSSTGLDGPQYLAFDREQLLWVTNYNPSTQHAELVEFAPQATGNVVALSTTALVGRPRGIAFSPKMPSPQPSSSIKPLVPVMVIAEQIPTNVYPSQLLLYTANSTAPFQSIAGPKPGLKLPGGIAIDRFNHVYVANIQGASVSQFVIPTASPTPRPTPTTSPSPTPSPTPTPTGSPSPTPTPVPTATPINIYPRFTITSKNELITPTSVALDKAGNIYVVDQGHPNAKCHASNSAAILVFPPYNKRIPYGKPTRKIQGCNTKLNLPSDIKVNSDGLIYVADSTRAGVGIIYIFPAGASGGLQNVAPTNYTSPGAVTGLGLVP